VTNLQLLSWFSLVVNIACASANCWLIYRNAQRRKRELAALDDSVKELMTEMAPTIAFAVAMRDMPGVPDSVRRFAASVIPKSVDVQSGMIPLRPTEKVH
jgi:hypothetical protein